MSSKYAWKSLGEVLTDDWKRTQVGTKINLRIRG